MIAACSASDPPPSANEGGGQATASDTDAPLSTGNTPTEDSGTVGGGVQSLPLTGLLRASNDFAAALAQLQTTNVNECMAAQGFDYRLPPASAPGDALSEAEELARRYGAPQQLSTDGVRGYAFDRPGDNQQGPEEPRATDEEARVLVGEVVATELLNGAGGQAVGEVQIGDGCVGQSLVEIFGSTDQYIEFSQLQAFIDSVSSNSLSSLYSDPDAVTASTAWSECMEQRGFAYTTPFDVANQDWDSPRPGVTEQQTAEADHACREETGVDAELAELDEAAQLQLLEGADDVPDQLASIYASVINQADSQ